jgi:hypothetical protein
MKLIGALRLLVPVMGMSLFFLSIATFAELPVKQNPTLQPSVLIPNPNEKNQGTITITSPLSGATVYVGTSQPIQWTCNGTHSNVVTVTLWKSNNLMTTITKGSATGRTAYTIPTILGRGDYEIRVTSDSDTGVEAKQLVVVNPGIVRFSSPIQNISWRCGIPHTITWYYTGAPGPMQFTLEGLGYYQYKQVISDNVFQGQNGMGQINLTLPRPPLVTGSFNIVARRVDNSLEVGRSNPFKLFY